jgi:vitamin K-dependent gamma-carboxylase
VVYTFAGLAKLHGDWLIHGQPLRIWLTSRTDVPLVGALFTLPHAPLLLGWAGFLFDTLAPWFLLPRRTRPYAYAAVVVFHGMTRLLFPIGMFPVIMVLGALVFFSPGWPQPVLRLLRLRPAAGTTATPWAGRYPFLATVAAYAMLQLLVPLRFLAYGGNVRWHEQGMRFSWRVMVREKNGSVVFHVRDPRTGHTWQVSPHRYLTRLQEREMSGQPDLILQFAHFLARDFAARGVVGVEVRAEARVSLNGRRAALLIDPTVDLVPLRDGVMPAPWILQAPEDPPPHTRPI